MHSLLQPDGRAALIARIGALRADMHPQWGKLTCVQMLVHCQRTLQTAVGELKLARRLIGRLFGGFAKRKYVEGEALFGHGSPTDPAFRPPPGGDFAPEQARLIELVRRFAEPGAITGEPHPFFGPMTVENWDRLMGKHLDHHLRQFGV